MNWQSLGDAAAFRQLNTQTRHLRNDLQRLTLELSSGQRADPGRATGGDFTVLADIRRGLKLNEAFANTVAETAITLEYRQAALESVALSLDALAPALQSAANNDQGLALSLRLADAPMRFDQVVAAMNTRVGGQSLFAGDAPDQPALRDAAAILDDLKSAVGATSDAATIVQMVEAWFHDAGGGFETTDWLGGTGAAPALLVGEGVLVDGGIDARDPALRRVLSGLALAALATDFGGDESERQALAAAAAVRIGDAETGLIALRAELGSAQEQIDEARVRTDATRTGLQIEQGRILDADPYTAATELEDVGRRLESLYVMTARLSRLSLTEYLR